MARIEVDGIGIEYELHGPEGAPPIAITPGGRFSMESPGVRELAQALGAKGRRALIWDRPNCGLSDVCLDADNESELHARALIGLGRELGLGPMTLAGGSAGSRVTLIAASRFPEAVSRVAVWWITGGPIGLMGLVGVYCGDGAAAAARGGMAPVLETMAWAEQAERNPAARAALLAMDPQEFIARMQQWATFYIPSPDSPVPGMAPEDFARLTMPVLILQNGESDVHHTRPTTEWAHKMIPHSRLIDPPWRDDEWNRRGEAAASGQEGAGLFSGWPALAPVLVEYTAA